MNKRQNKLPKKINQVVESIQNNDPLYVRIEDSELAGSIAKFTTDDSKVDNATKYVRFYGNTTNYEITVPYISGHLTWTGRKNKRKASGGYDDITFLLGYDGETVFLKEDFSAAVEAQKTAKRLDIDGIELTVGDPVIYINARYGSGMLLEHGTITEFKV